jgi:hypothetical protein
MKEIVVKRNEASYFARFNSESFMIFFVPYIFRPEFTGHIFWNNFIQ